MSDNRESLKLRKIRFVYKGAEQEGTLIHENSGLLTIKLKSGYNIVAEKGAVEIKEESLEEAPQARSSKDTFIGSGPGKVTIVATGGTISSRVDYSTGAVTPSNDISFLKSTVTDLERRFTVELESRDNILSENMTPEKWVNI
ncbi:MAG TPA: asparaginase domain-containing protein, partial [Thermoplasmataceae archaeon]|nr:asparaginase domain-containing protein [Thermoplasmataceae archaeon]